MRYSFEIDGVFVNPQLPENFDSTAHEDRDEISLSWWDKPYIVVESLKQESWIEHYMRLKNEYEWSDEDIGTQEDWEQYLQRERNSWFETFPAGFRYNVRCLDGGAWDRSTNHGFFDSFEEALKFVNIL